MIETESKTKRERIEARPRINTSEGGDYESWHRRALIRYTDIVRLIGEEPADLPCERWGTASQCSRRLCDVCATRFEWEAEVCEIIRGATDWALFGSGYGVEGCPGRPFADAPHIYRHKRHPGVLVMSWSGGLDI